MKAIVGGITAAAIAFGGIALAAPAQASVFQVCPSGYSGVVVGTPTSCPFADNVRAAYLASGGASRILAYSRVTGYAYAMGCWSTVADFVGRDQPPCRAVRGRQ